MEDKATLYLETSVISYLVGRLHSNAVTLAYQQITREWWETERKDYKCFVSTLVLEEIGEGDPVLSGQREELVNNIDVLDVASEVPELAQIYFEALGLPDKARPDCLHLAISNYYEIDYLLTWNLKHIANPVFIKRVYEKNQDLGIDSSIILTIEQLIEMEKEKKDED